MKLVFLAATANCVSSPSYSTSAPVATSTAAGDNKHPPVVASSYTTHYSKCFTCGILSSLPTVEHGYYHWFLNDEPDSWNYVHIIQQFDSQARM